VINRLLLLYVLILTVCAAAVATLTPGDEDRWLRFAYSTVAAVVCAVAAGIVLAFGSKPKPKKTSYDNSAAWADLPFSQEDRSVTNPPSPLDSSKYQLGISVSFDSVIAKLEKAVENTKKLSLMSANDPHPLAAPAVMAISDLRRLESEIHQQLRWMQAANIHAHNYMVLRQTPAARAK